jgi:hypothetical protein
MIREENRQGGELAGGERGLAILADMTRGML